jgi:hypothetical protein
LLFGTDNRPTQAFAAFLRDAQVPGDDLPGIDAALQARFFQKGPDGQPLERWELTEVTIQSPWWCLFLHLTICGFTKATDPQSRSYPRAGWPGALMTRAIVRLADLVHAWERGVRYGELVVFGGKRPLIPENETPAAARNQEELPIFISQAACEEGFAFLQRNGVRTELDMMRWLWANAHLPRDLRELPVTFVDAPMKPPAKPGGQLIRPTTEDTIAEWLKSNPSPGCLLLSSGAPYGMAQDEAFWMLLEHDGHTVETFGHAAPDAFPLESYMREVAGCVHRIRRARERGR